MRPATQCSLVALAALAVTAFAPAAVAQQASEALPWQKQQQAPQPDPDVQELLPWLLGEGGNKKPKSGAVWNASVAEPKGPAEPQVADPGMAPGTHIETGAIVPSGLVLKSKVPGAHPVVNAAAGGDGAAKIQRSVPLPGDHPVSQSEANEVSADQSGQVPSQRAAEDAAPVAPANAAAVPADQLAPPSGEPAAAAEATAAAEGAKPVAVPAAVTEAETPHGALAAPPVEHLPAPASPVRAAFPRAKAVNAVPKDIGLAAPKGDLAAPVAGHEAAHEQTAQATVANEAPVDGAAPAAAPEAARAVENVPALPVAEEAPPVPDPLPDAVVTPVPQPEKAKEEAGLPRVKPPLPKSLAENANVAQQYCFNIADAAKDARYAWQKKTLADIETELNKRIALLDARTAEYQKWLARRDEFIRNAEENVVKIMSGMRPDAAAVQLTLMNEEAAAAVIAKLSSRNSSAILNEMDPAKAAKLTMIITGATKLKRKKELQQNMTPGQSDGSKPAAPAGARAESAQPQGGRS